MSFEDELRSQLLAASDIHQPDEARIRARFDAGVAAELRARQAVARLAMPRHRGPSHEIISRLRSSPKRLVGSGLVVALTVAVVCGVTVAIQNTAGRDTGSGPGVLPIPPAASSSLAASESATPLPTPGPVPYVRPPSATAPSGTSPSGTSTSAASPSAASPSATSAAANSAPAVTRCGPFDSVAAGSFVIDNNLWAANRGTGTQCVRASPGPATSIGWSSTWDWSGGPGQVKSFSSVVLGWRWGYAPGPAAGLPVQLSDHHAIRTHWAYTLTQSRPGNVDVAYDVWLHSTPHPGNNERPAAEMRVLFDKAAGGVVGQTHLGTFTIGGGSWDLYLSTAGGWNGYSFVRSTPATGPVDLDLTDFTDTIARLGRLPSALYVTSVQAGVDVVDGKGGLTTSAYSVTIN